LIPKTLSDIITRDPAPAPWSEGDNIPWHEPAFSERMLKEHLTQEHDAASRRFEKIVAHVTWIHQDVLNSQPGKILDLGCGPGLYSSRLARLGHQVTGIDYSPASIAYAQELTDKEKLACNFIHADIREANYGSSYDTAMLIFGEFNVFRPTDIRKILTKTHAALKPGGVLILEPHTFEAIEGIGYKPTSWFTSEQGLFSPQSHLVLTENFWDEDQNTATIRHFVVETETGNVIRYAQSMQAYDQQAYQAILEEIGFGDIRIYPSLKGTPDPEQEGLIAITAVKKIVNV
jgi:SAM-dependent methyltransferase